MHLQRDLDQIKRELLKMGSLVAGALDKAMTAVVARRKEVAAEVIAGDDVVDNQEVHVENECLKALALHQPVASDLRFVVSVLKVNNDLERMGDLAVNIAERAQTLASQPPLLVPLRFQEMVDRVREMVRASLDALVEGNADLARWVCRADSQVDEMNREMFEALQKVMKEDPANIERGVLLLSTCRHLERIADHATNIAEDVVFLVEGAVIRHSKAARLEAGKAEPRRLPPS